MTLNNLLKTFCNKNQQNCNITTLPGSLKTGNAGSRVACCTIAVSKDESTDNYQISNNSY